MQKKPLILALLAGIALSGAAQAGLMDRGGGLIYDTDLNLTWLADANYAKTSDFDADGKMDWAAAKAWAAVLSYGGYSDWRLPTTLQPDASCSIQSGGYSSGVNCTGSEMGHLFYTEGGLTAGQSILADPPGVLDDYFTNMQSDVYWSGTVYAPHLDLVWYFGTTIGTQNAYDLSYELYAWAVRSGDVAAVPEPATLLLLGLGLVGLGAMRRRG